MNDNLAGTSPVEREVRPCLVVYGDGLNDDSDALQEFLDGRADLVHADGTPYKWPGTPGRKYALAKPLILGGPSRATRARGLVAKPLDPGAWIGCQGQTPD